MKFQRVGYKVEECDIYDVTITGNEYARKEKYTDKTNLCVKICRRISDIEFALDSSDSFARDADNLRDELEECERVLNLINVG